MDSSSRADLFVPTSRIFRKPLYWLASWLLITAPALTLPAQNSPNQLPLQSLSLNDLSAFRQAADNWKIAGDVTGDLDKPNILHIEKGKGVLVNLPDSKNKDNLFTQFEHGDLDLELDFMMAKGSNSGIFLQGRYEVQLLDSWGVQTAKSADVGGIYERWDESKPEGQKSYQGYAPRMNAAKAPGLWQTLKIAFQAPRFDSNGNKIANARMLRVELNGITIHENVELTGTTRGSISDTEKPQGPIMIQGDHGPVAFRNIRYQNYTGSSVTLSNLSYSYYPGKFDKLPDFKSLKAEKEGKMPELTYAVVNNPDDRYMLRLKGALKITEPGSYLFTLRTGGASSLTIGTKKVTEESEKGAGVVELAAGEHPFEITYRKPEEWISPALGLYAESATVRRHPLHILSSMPTRNPVDPIIAQVTGNTRILRSFIDFRKEANGPTKRITHAASVGSPDHISYTVDLKTGAIVYAWKGGFLDATPMWHGRGGGDAHPIGSVVALSDAPPLAVLSDRNAAWPDTISAQANFRSFGYDVDEQGSPIFRYRINGVEVEDQIRSEENGKYLSREMRLNGTATGNLYSRVAEGREIAEVGKGLYAVDGKSYYIRLAADAKPLVRTVNNRRELLLPVQGNSVRYSIIW